MNSMNHMSENYRLRKYFLSTQEVPSLSMMREKMREPLAALYFKTMTPKLKVLAGLEPSLKGGGGNWYVPPKDLLDGITVLKPIKKEHLTRLNYLGIDEMCAELLKKESESQILEMNTVLSEDDDKWRKLIKEKCEQLFKDCSLKKANKNSVRIRKEFEDFSTLYSLCITNIETVLFEAPFSEIHRIQNETLQTMKAKYQTYIKHQATALYDTFTNRLETEKLKLRDEFVETLARYRDEFRNNIHDLKVEKHVNIENCREFLECQRLACQVYVALKEQEECQKEIKLSDQIHKKAVKALSDEIARHDYEIAGRGLKEKMQQDIESIWQKKVRHVFKYFQMCVSYCLSLMPAHADFFINMEKLMLLQLNEALENPNAESIFKEKESYEDPSPAPHPFYLFCDKSHKKEVRLERDLCPKRCTSSASQMPVIVINKRCMYAACDNFEQFTNKVKHYIYDKRGDDMDFTDDHVYEYDVPVKYTTSKHLLELKLESSLLQILHKELTNTTDTSIVCTVCKLPYCFCKSQTTKAKSYTRHEKAGIKHNIPQSTTARNISKAICEDHRTEPGMESYLKSIVPKRCMCNKTAKKHLEEHLPVYMKRLSIFDVRNHLPTYETCSLTTLKKIVRKSRGSIDLPAGTKLARTRDVGTQYTDEQYDTLCTCFSDEMIFNNDLMKAQPVELSQFYHPSTTATNFDFLDNSRQPTPDMDSSSASSTDRERERAIERKRARSLKASFSAVPELGEIFNIDRLRID